MSDFTLRNIALMNRLRGRIALMAATPQPKPLCSQIRGNEPDITPVSYTHLTLPTKDSV